jgi:hypothetical protein
VTELSQLAKKQQRSLAKIKGVGTRYLARIKALPWGVLNWFKKPKEFALPA